MTIALNHRKVLGVSITDSPKVQVLEFILSSLKNRDKLFLVTPNPEILVESTRDVSFKKILNSADVALPDGAGLALAGVKNRILGRKLFVDLLTIAESKSMKVYLLGAKNSVNKLAVKIAKNNYPKLAIAGRGDFSVNYKGEIDIKSDKNIYKEVLRDINSFKPDFLFVAFGAPKQEKWIWKHLPQIQTKLAMGVGGTLDYYTGTKAHVPGFVSAVGLEWLWRLAQEPKRLKRILNATIVFPALLFRERLS